MVLSKRFKYFLIAGGMSFLFLASLHAESIDKRINHPIVDNIHERNADGSSLKADQVLITPDQFLDAVQRGSFEIVKIALVQGMDINVQNETAESALHLVKDVALAKYLIARGAKVNLPDRQFGMTPLFFSGGVSGQTPGRSRRKRECRKPQRKHADHLVCLQQLSGRH